MFIIYILRVCRFADEVSAPLSFPAKSIKENFPCIWFKPGIRNTI